MLLEKSKLALSALVALGLSLPGFGATMPCPEQVQSPEQLPRMIVIRTMVDKQGEESVAKFYMINIRKQVVDETSALEANQMLECAEGQDLDIEAEDRSAPEEVVQLKNIMSNVADAGLEDSWQRNRWGFSVGVGPFHFYGYGNRGHYGYSHRQPWRHSNYGFYHRNRYYPYYGSRYSHYRQPYRYYYYSNPYYRW